MNKANIEGDARGAYEQGDPGTSETPKHKPTTSERAYDEFLGQSPSALVDAKDQAVSDADASAIDLSGVKDEIAKLTQSVTELVQKRTSTTRDQLMGAVGAAGDNLSQSASVAQDGLVSIEKDVGIRIRNNPWGAVAIAAVVGLLISKMT